MRVYQKRAMRQYTYFEFVNYHYKVVIVDTVGATPAIPLARQAAQRRRVLVLSRQTNRRDGARRSAPVGRTGRWELRGGHRRPVEALAGRGLAVRRRPPGWRRTGRQG